MTYKEREAPEVGRARVQIMHAEREVKRLARLLQTAIERDQLAKAERLREDLKQEQAHLKQQREHLNRLLEEAQ
jgi:hypothetical protein